MEKVIDLLQTEEVYHSTLDNAIQEAIGTLKNKGVEVDIKFALMIIKIVSLDPANNFLIKQPIERIEVERLKKVVVERIMSMTSLTRNMIRMQLHYKANHFSREQIVEVRQLDLDDKIKKSMTEMIKSIPKHQKHFDTYYEKLLVAAIIRIGLGSQSDFYVVKETNAALTIIFPKEDIEILRTMTLEERETELYRLMKLTAGIRLYNRDLDPENLGAAIPDLCKIIPEKLNEHLTFVNDLHERNIRRLIVYATLTQKYFLNEHATTNKYGRREFEESMVNIRHGLTMIHQLLIYFKQLTEDIMNEQKLNLQFIQEFNDRLADLRKTLGSKEPVSTSYVYPKFEALAGSWEKLQDSLLYTESCGLLISALEKFSEENLKEIDPIVLEMADMNQIPSEAEFFSFPEYANPEDSFTMAQWLPFSEIDISTVQYSGFCSWSLVKGYGLVVLSNPNIGIYSWKGKQYLFSTPEGADEFAQTPDKFIFKAVLIAHRWPQLIHFLNMEEEVFDADFIQAAERATTPIDVKIWSDTEIQTELHPLATNIVQGYTWNEWELRRQAIILSTIHKCATHSTQTHWQALKKTQQVQTYPARNQRTQTNQAKYSEAPRNQFYFYGLRGLHSYPPHITELTREPVMELKCHVKNLSQLERQFLAAAELAAEEEDEEPQGYLRTTFPPQIIEEVKDPKICHPKNLTDLEQQFDRAVAEKATERAKKKAKEKEAEEKAAVSGLGIQVEKEIPKRKNFKIRIKKRH